MDKKTKLYVGIGLLGVGAYLYFRSTKNMVNASGLPRVLGGTMPRGTGTGGAMRTMPKPNMPRVLGGTMPKGTGYGGSPRGTGGTMPRGSGHEYSGGDTSEYDAQQTTAYRP